MYSESTFSVALVSALRHEKVGGRKSSKKKKMNVIRWAQERGRGRGLEGGQRSEVVGGGLGRGGEKKKKQN